MGMKASNGAPSESRWPPAARDATVSGHKGEGFQAQIVEIVVAGKDPKVKSGSLNFIVGVEGAP